MKNNKEMMLFYKQDFIKETNAYEIHKLFCAKFKKNVTVNAIYNYLRRHKIQYKAISARKKNGYHRRKEYYYTLSPAEKEILPFLSCKNSEIAKILYKESSTIASQIQSIFDKLGVNSKIGALIIALKKGLINIEEIKSNARTNNHRRR